MGEYGLNDYYKEKLREGLEYQDFVFEQLRYMDGMPIFLGAYASEKYQYQKGESPSGLEIKHDKRFHETGNLFIEIAEKSDASLSEYTPSGIMRNDNSWLYLIGDYEQAFIFPKKLLRAVCVPSNKNIMYREINTAQGYLFPLNYIDKKCLCAKHIIFRR